jgi:hypothetical protein
VESAIESAAQIKFVKLRSNSGSSASRVKPSLLGKKSAMIVMMKVPRSFMSRWTYVVIDLYIREQYAHAEHDYVNNEWVHNPSQNIETHGVSLLPRVDGFNLEETIRLQDDRNILDSFRQNTLPAWRGDACQSYSCRVTNAAIC